MGRERAFIFLLLLFGNQDAHGERKEIYCFYVEIKMSMMREGEFSCSNLGIKMSRRIERERELQWIAEELRGGDCKE